MAVQPISAVSGGQAAHVRGVVRRAHGEPLSSRLGGKACVYWDVRRGLHEAPTDRDGQDFWVEDATGRVLVRGRDVEADVLAERQRQVVRAADADHRALSERLRELKTELRSAAGKRARELIEERKRLAKIVTVLLAVRAHGRGRVHVGGSLPAQERWIHEHAASVDTSAGVKSLELVAERWEVVLEEGQEVEVEGFAQVEHVPATLAGGGGSPTRLQGAAARRQC